VRVVAVAGVRVALAAVAGRWTTLVLRELTCGPHSFGALRARLPTGTELSRLHTPPAPGV
jgi:DNA-binding HxlR family transcriptional regulator